jgi:hypothetical protein
MEVCRAGGSGGASVGDAGAFLSVAADGGDEGGTGDVGGEEMMLGAGAGEE